MIVAVVQIESRPGEITANHARAMPLIEEAALRGARLVILPELSACGYIPNPTVWQYAETLTGPTLRWLRVTAQRLGIYLGAGFAEVDGTHFHNSFALATPDGDLAGCARKTMTEANCFRYGHGRHFFTTDIGRIGAGICADNHVITFLRLMEDSGIGLLLMPHASPLPFRTSKLMSPAFFRLPGLSRIVDADGTLRGELGQEEGVLVAEVDVGSAHESDEEVPDHGGWLHPGSALLRRVLRPVDLSMARARYALSRRRRRLARRLVTDAAAQDGP